MLRTLIILTLMILLSSCASVGVLRPKEGIRASLLELTPHGSTEANVLALVEKKGWKYDVIYYPAHSLFIANHGNKGVRAWEIRAALGAYHWPPLGSTLVVASWGFDEKGRLADISIDKTIDSL